MPAGSTVFVDATGSSDPDGDPLSYQWAITQRPAGSAAQLSSTTTFATSFVADLPGNYVVQLIVSDGLLASAPDTVTIGTGNVAPTANAGPDQLVSLGQTVRLDGGGSTDANGDAVSYSWSLVSVPAGSGATLTNASIVNPAFVADLFGTYVAQLIVSDGTLAGAPDTVSISVRPGTISLALVGTALVGVGSSERLAVTINPVAPAGGTLVTVVSDDTSVLTIGPPASVLIPQGSAAGEVTVNGISAGTATVRASAPGYTEGALTIGGTPNVISVPATLTAAPGQTVSLPISIAPNPAPSGGLTIDVVSSDPARVAVLTPAVTIPEGAVSANATIRGAGVGVATITASTAGFVSGRSQVTTTANLNIVQTTAAFNAGFTSSISIQLESAGSQVAAPPSGVTVTLTAENPACVSATSPVTIGAGLTSVASTLSYGGSATLPCTTIVTARATDMTPDTVSVTVSPAAGVTLIGLPATVGAGLQTGLSFTARLGAAQHGGRTMHLESSNPAVALLALNTTTPGTAALDVPLANGSTDVSFVIQGVEGAPVPASATITASATGFASATGTANVVRPALQIASLGATATTLSADGPFVVQVGLPSSGQAFLNSFQTARRGGPGLTATVTHTNPTVAQLVTTPLTAQTVTVAIPAGQSSSAATVAAGGVAFHAVSPGQTTVSAAIPGFTTTTAGSVAVTISGPGITMIGLPATVGAGLQTGLSFTARLAASQHGGVTMHLESSNPAVALLALNTTTPGTAALDVPLANGSTDVSFVIQGVEGAPVPSTASITASAAGFSNGTGSVTVVRPALQIASLGATATTLSADGPFVVQVGLPSSGQAFLNSFQVARRGGPGLTATVTHTNPTVAQLVTTPLTAQTVTVAIPPGQSSSAATVAAGGVAFHAVSPGQTTVSAAIPGFTTTTAGSVAVTISGPGITTIGLPATVGAGLQTGLSFTARLTAAQHGGVTMHLESSNPAVALLALNTTTPGTAALDVPLANGSTDVSFVIQGMEGAPVPSTLSITASAAGFSNGTGSVTVVQPALQIASLGATATTLSADGPFVVQVGLPSSGQAFLNSFQVARRGGPGLTAAVTHTNPAVAQLITTAATGQTVTVTIPAGQSSSPATVVAGGVAFHALSSGPTSVAASIPGFIATAAAHVPVTVSAPAVTMIGFPATVGAGLQTGLSFTARLAASQHGGVTMHLESSNPAVALIAPNTTAAGSASLDVFLANGSTDVTFVIQGMESAPVPSTVIVTASAAGFTNGTGSVTVVRPALQIASLGTSTTAAAADGPFQVQIGIPNSTEAFLNSFQVVRRGGAPLTVTVTHTNPAAAQLRTPALTGQTVTVVIGVGQSSSPATVAAGGVAFDPVAPGQTIVTASIPGFVVTTAGSVTVTITP